MINKLPLVRRITIAFVLLTVLVSGIFSIGIVEIVHYIEEQLVSEEMAHELDFIVSQARDTHTPPVTDPNTLFFSTTLGDHAVPPQFNDLAPGFSEVVDNDAAYYVFKRVEGDDIALLVQDQQDFEAREDMLYVGVTAGFLISVLLSWLFGRLVARHAVAPVLRLAQQVRRRDQMVAVAPPLASDYPRDEVGDLATAFDSAINRLQQALEREFLFTSDVSHELRTPLMVMASSCELLLESPAMGPGERAQVERIERACQEMRALVETFMFLARQDNNPVAMTDTITLDLAATEQYQNWQEKFIAKGLDFNLVRQGHDDSRYPAVFLKSVISNLLRNALHYTDQGGVRLILDENGFSVQDTGSGIPASQRERIFQPFTRGEKSRGEGLGLGLSLVKRICQHQGWKVSINTAASGGSIFHVQLKKSSV